MQMQIPTEKIEVPGSRAARLLSRRWIPALEEDRLGPDQDHLSGLDRRHIAFKIPILNKGLRSRVVGSLAAAAAGTRVS